MEKKVDFTKIPGGKYLAQYVGETISRKVAHIEKLNEKNKQEIVESLGTLDNAINNNNTYLCVCRKNNCYKIVDLLQFDSFTACGNIDKCQNGNIFNPLKITPNIFCCLDHSDFIVFVCERCNKHAYICQDCVKQYGKFCGSCIAIKEQRAEL